MDRMVKVGYNTISDTSDYGNIINDTTGTDSSTYYQNPCDWWRWDWRMQMSCPKCGKCIECGDRYCRHCGKQLYTPKFCPHCGKEI